MNVTYNKFKILEPPALTLCSPNCSAKVQNGDVVLNGALGLLPNCKKITLSPNFNTLWELSFEFSDSSNTQIHYMFNNLEKGRYIYASDIGFFIIDDYSRYESNTKVYKEISCHSVEKEIEKAECPLLNEGSYYFYTKEKSEGILQKQMALLPNWSVDFISDDLKEKTAYFDGENEADNAYDFLWNKIEEAFECVIDVNLISKKLSFYSLDYYAAHHKTDIHLSKSNDLKEVTVQSKNDDCFTAVTVNQKDNLSLSYSNPNGSETIYNFTHCLKYMSDNLKSAIYKWQAKYDASITPYKTLSLNYAKAKDDLSNAEKDLDILKQELDILKTQKDAIINKNVSDSAKNTDLSMINLQIAAKNGEISAQKVVISAKKTNISNTYTTPLSTMAKECSLSLTAKDLNGNAVFTQALLNELSAYVNPAEYTDDYISITDDMKYTEIFEQSQKLFDRAKRELQKLSTQSYTFSVTNNSFLFNEKFKRFSKQLAPGAIVYLETSQDTIEQVHLTNFTVDYTSKTVSFTFGNKYDKNDVKSLFDDVFGSVKSSASAVKYLKNIVNDQKSLLQKQKDWIDNALTLTKNHALTSEHQTVLIDDSGYWGKKLLLDNNGNIQYDTNNNPLYENEQIKIINNGVYLSTDNWNSISTAIGKIYLYHDTETNQDVFRYGVAGDLIVGKLLLGKELALLGSPKADGTYAITLNENGLTIINDGTSAGLTIKDANNHKQLYADSSGNLWLNGKINATGGNIAGWLINSNELTKSFSTGGHSYKTFMRAGASPETAAFYVEKDGSPQFYVRYDGFLLAKNAEIQGKITATTGKIAGWNITSSEFNKEITANGHKYKAVVQAGSAPETAAFYVKKDNDLQFYVRYDGFLLAKNANITGTISASAGNIGGWKISSNELNKEFSSGGHTYKTFMRAGASPQTAALYVEKDSEAQFYVRYDGFLMAKNAEIQGKITATSGSFTGTINATSGMIKDGVKLGTDGNCAFYAYDIGHGLKGCKLKYTDTGYLSIGQGSQGEEINLRSSSWITIEAGQSITITANTGTLEGTWYHRASDTVTSDINKKHNIKALTNNYLSFLKKIKPVTFKYNDGTSNRNHTGFIAQQVAESLKESNISTQDFAGLVVLKNENNSQDWYLRYEEFIPLNTAAIQVLFKKISLLESEISMLKQNK